MGLFKKKIKVDKGETADYGTFKYAFQTGTTSPVTFYHQRLEFLKNKRLLKQQKKKEKREKK